MRVASRKMRLQVVRCGCESRDAVVGREMRLRVARRMAAGRGMRMRLRVARCELLLPNVEGLGNCK